MKLEPVKLNQYADVPEETEKKPKTAPGTEYLCPNCLHAAVCLLAAESARIGAQITSCLQYFPMRELDPAPSSEE